MKRYVRVGLRDGSELALAYRYYRDLEEFFTMHKSGVFKFTTNVDTRGALRIEDVCWFYVCTSKAERRALELQKEYNDLYDEIFTPVDPEDKEPWKS